MEKMSLQQIKENLEALKAKRDKLLAEKAASGATETVVPPKTDAAPGKVREEKLRAPENVPPTPPESAEPAPAGEAPPMSPEIKDEMRITSRGEEHWRNGKLKLLRLKNGDEEWYYDNGKIEQKNFAQGAIAMELYDEQGNIKVCLDRRGNEMPIENPKPTAEEKKAATAEHPAWWDKVPKKIQDFTDEFKRSGGNVVYDPRGDAIRYTAVGEFHECQIFRIDPYRDGERVMEYLDQNGGHIKTDYMDRDGNILRTVFGDGNIISGSNPEQQEAEIPPTTTTIEEANKARLIQELKDAIAYAQETIDRNEARKQEILKRLGEIRGESVEKPADITQRSSLDLRTELSWLESNLHGTIPVIDWTKRKDLKAKIAELKEKIKLAKQRERVQGQA